MAEKQKWTIIDPNGKEKEILLTENEEIVKRTMLKAGQQKFLDNKNAKTELIANTKGFVNIMYVSNELLFNDMDLSPSDITRFLYLCTFIEWNDKEENLLIQKRIGKANIPMTRKDIQEALGLSENAFKKFLLSMKKNNLIFEVPEKRGASKLYVTNEFVTKGKTPNNNKKYTRLFIEPIRILYKSCDSRQHKQLAYIFQLIPFLDYDTNLLMKENGGAIELKELMEMLRLSTNSKNAVSVFKNNLLKFKLSYDEQEYYVFGTVTLKFGKEERDYLAINPLCFWQSNNVENFKTIFNQLLIR